MKYRIEKDTMGDVLVPANHSMIDVLKGSRPILNE
jgi:hypothetical protein